MARNRCSQCDKELPPSWAERAKENWDPVCPDCAARDLKKQSIRRRRILDTSVRRKASLELIPKPADPASASAPGSSQPVSSSKVPAASSSKTSIRTPIPMEIELDTDDPVLLAAQQAAAAAAEESAKVDSLEETKQIRKPKWPPGPQVRLNF